MVLHAVTKKLESKTRRFFFEVVNDSDVAAQGELRVKLRKLLGASFTHRVKVPALEPEKSWMFYFDAPKGMESFYDFEWEWLTMDGQRTGKGRRVKQTQDVMAMNKGRALDPKKY